MKLTLELNPRNVVRGLLGALFCWAALSKLANPPIFFGDLLTYQLPLTKELLRMVAVVLPWLELICGFMLLAGFQLRAALGWSLVLFGIFITVTGQAWAHGLDISCGCFDFTALGLDSVARAGKFLESAPGAFFRALALFAVTLWLWRTQPDAGNNS